MSLKNSIEFMLYTNFGVDFKDGNIDTILNVAIDKAYNDATMQGAYNALKKENAKEIKIDSIKAHLKNEIIDLLGKGSDIDYNNWHNSICNYLIETAFKDVVLVKDNKQQAFTYGNAQKWINMTMKYLYILSESFHAYASNCKFDKYYNRIQNLYKDLQVPVDSYILEAVWNKDKQVNGIPYNTGKLTKKKDNDKRNIPGSYSSEKVNSWSKWNETEYIKFRDSFRKSKTDVIPIEWEHNAWISIAKQRKEKEKQKNK